MNNEEKNETKKPKSFKNIFELMLSKKVSDDFKENLSCYMKPQKRELSIYEAMALVQLTKALNGDTKAFELVRDTLGQKNPSLTDTAFGGVIKVVVSDD